MKSALLLLGFVFVCACGKSDSGATSAADQANTNSLAETAMDRGERDAPQADESFTLKAGGWATDYGTPNFSQTAIPPDGVQEIVSEMSTGFDYCLPAATASAPDAEFFSGSPNGGCSYDTISFGGGKFEGVMRCDGDELRQSIQFSGTYDPESYQMSSVMTISDGQASMTVALSQSGRRVGNCS